MPVPNETCCSSPSSETLAMIACTACLGYVGIAGVEISPCGPP